ncbi:hypothetical protein EDEG_01775 [Edhazardia aedis USNM 41457]|uniref:Uncharacterized protein n=1 Tax=Edhazardia aedis (strain USNM 41457) TaxID=1003232 RepID=J9DRH6_EDHAE|nr:hypothetical protein EDEG_01775 [Edhazardia aedis USNM 41457]|eukprot:EJW03937.1 hypothetical protein EDEG_01775 [Edhazardia aedis USNM 41457]
MILEVIILVAIILVKIFNITTKIFLILQNFILKPTVFPLYRTDTLEKMGRKAKIYIQKILNTNYVYIEKLPGKIKLKYAIIPIKLKIYTVPLLYLNLIELDSQDSTAYY